ncbi:response regulator [Sphingobacterium sp. DN00404]|uniref:histidine kinase n=1 Tax=Sphingobacterium micropteri TaxID=2763501 RepID=A0ABR7YTA6_9SPHI|nr:ATP-binding protein [Sphingobacterium micropteri]MBD1434579.1 response regulator [Sphingobacterium micropteri]
MILIVDDQIENIYSLEKLLKSKGFEVDSALSGEEALKKVLKNDYALVILDVQMPGIDGFEVAETLSGYSKTKEVPIIFLSAVNTDKKFIAKGYASGGIDYITKPVDPDILILKVKTFYRLYEQTLALNDAQKILESEIETRKKAQQELKDKVEHLHTTLESLPQIAFTADARGNITFVNKRWYNYSPCPETFPEVHPDDTCIKKVWRHCIEWSQPLELEVRIKELKSGHFCFHLLRIIPVKDKTAIRSWVGTFTDIHEQKEEERKKDEFLSIASHELKTPLTSIKAYIQLLERMPDVQKESKFATYISRAQNQVNKLHSLIADLLDISKIENGKLKVNKKPFDMEKLIESAIETIGYTHSHVQVKIERQGETITKEVNGDAFRIEQVLINFLTNAIKYSPDSDRVVVHTVVDKDQLYIAVQDFGIGIPEHKKNNIFTKFYRVEESSVKFQGLGIGLYICAEIIKQHNGTYGIASSSNQGTTFYFTIPFN